MKKRAMSMALAGVMALGFIGTVDLTTVQAAEKTKIRVYVGGDNADLNAGLIDAFNEQSTDAEAELVTLTDGQNGYQMLTVMYNSNSAPNVFFLEEGDVKNLQDKLADVSDMECLQYAVDGATDGVTYGDKILGVPVKTQAYGLIYNKTALANALGEDFDVTSLTSLSDFDAVCKELQEKGIAPTIISPYNWSLGNHYFTMIYGAQEDPDSFIEELKNGTADLANNAVFNEYMDTFDTLMSYNYYIDNPLEDVASEAVTQSQTLYTEQAMFWFQGSWESSVIRQLDNENEYGFIPVPLENAESKNYGKICSVIPGYFCVDSACSTEEEQQAAKEFIEFATMSDEGQQYVIDDGNIPAYTNNDKEITESLVQSAYDYISKDESFPMYTNFAGDHYEKVGNAMQQYLDKEIDRATLAAQIEEYWKEN